MLWWLAVSVGKTMVALAIAFKACGRASVSYGPVMVVPQMVLLLAWLPTRLAFLALEAAAKRVYWADTRIGRALAVSE